MAIVGPGRLGQALGKLLRQAAFRVELIAGRKIERARRAARFIGAGRAARLNDSELGRAGVILLTVSDGAVARVAEQLARRQDDWSGSVVLHTCGSLGTDALKEFRRRGAAVGSLHPYQTVPNPAAGARNLVGCYWSVDGDPRARRLGAQWVKRLRGIAFRVPAKGKIPYHLSAFLVCPTTVALMDQSERLLRLAGVPRRYVRPMLAQFVAETARNFARFGGKKALTGPVVRGDWETIRKHIAELRRASPDVLPAYLGLARLMAKLAGQRPGWIRRR